jgi:hypothetical protein
MAVYCQRCAERENIGPDIKADPDEIFIAERIN